MSFFERRESVQAKKATKVWIPDASAVWTLADIVSHAPGGDTIVVSIGEGKAAKKKKYKVAETYQYNADASRASIENIALMEDLHSAPLLHLLRKRYAAASIYTFVGDMSLTINPYRRIDGIDKFHACDAAPYDEHSRVRPHIYATANRAYSAMMASGKSQSILVNGESGAGKTEASKIVMRYLAQRSALLRDGAEDGGEDGAAPAASGVIGIEESFLKTNPIIEAFGNAKTVRNDNSSRFGKLIVTDFDTEGRIVGCSAKQFLLEKSRIVHQAAEERNYHAIYYLCAAAAADSTLCGGGLGIERPSDFFYLNQGECFEVAGVDDAAEFTALAAGLDAMGIELSEQEALWKVLAGVVHLGNVGFASEDSATGARAVLDSSTLEAIEQCAALWGVEAESLKLGMRQRSVTTRAAAAGRRASMHMIPLTQHQATESRDGLAKAVYAATFAWVVETLNAKTHAEGAHAFIGILDIFGFEQMEKNSFEQLCINYANEVLQNLFNTQIFEVEAKIYAEENIAVDAELFTHNNNGALVAMLEAKKQGIFSILDEQAMLGDRASDANFLGALKKSLNAHASFAQPRLAADQAFVVKHFAGDILYHVDSFVHKNQDHLQNDLISALEFSTNSVLRGAWKLRDAHSTFKLDKKTGRASIVAAAKVRAKKEGDAPESADAQPGHQRKKSSKAGKKMTGAKTVSTRFRGQMQSLKALLQSTRIHFIRCIKPNEKKSPALFDAPLVLNQLSFLGVMETVRIRKLGFPARMTFMSMAKRYRFLVSIEKQAELTHREQVAYLLAQYCPLPDGTDPATVYQAGRTKIFMKRRVVDILNDALSDVVQDSTQMVANMINRAVMRRRFKKQLLARRLMKWRVRSVLDRAAYLKKRNAARRMLALQRVHRCNVAKKVVHARRMEVARERGEMAVLTADAANVSSRVAAGAVEAAESAAQAADLAVKNYVVARIQKVARARQGKQEYELKCWASLKLQGHARRMKDSWKYKSIQMARKPWLRFLLPNERVILSSVVRKSGGGMLARTKRRQLILTSHPRIMYVKVTEMEMRGVIDLSTVEECKAGTEKGHFDIIIPGRTYDICVLSGSAPQWVSIINDAMPASALTREQFLQKTEASLSQSPLSKQGYLLLQHRTKAKKFTKHYYVLQGTELLRFGKKSATSADATDVIDSEASVRKLVGQPKPHCFEIAMYGPGGGTKVFSCESPSVQNDWINAIKAALVFARAAKAGHLHGGAARRASLTALSKLDGP